jgi:hypothetical protein
MTAKTRADIQTEIDALLANNTTGDISPTDVRTVHETSKDSNLNLIDVSGSQAVLGSVNFTGTDLQRNGFDIARNPTLRRLILAKSELPAPAAGVITLAPGVEYVLGDNFSLGTDRIVMGADTVYRGLDENVITNTYTGTGIMFTAEDVSCRLKGFTAACTSGTFISAKNTAGNEGTSNVILDNVDVDADTLGSIENLNIFAFFRCAFNTITTDGFTFVGSAGNVVTSNDCVIIQTAGDFLDLGVATFLSFDVNNYLMIGAGGTGFLKGAAGSANIRTGGLGRVIRGRNFGSETILSGISVDDALWDFQLNDNIADTRPDGLLSLQGNATNTVIAVAGTGVLVAGTWAVERASQMTGTTAGRLTYDGGKNATLPTTSSVSVAPVSGGTIEVSAEVAINGSVIANSKRTGSTSAGNPVSITMPWQAVFSTTNFVEIFVTNEDSTVDLLVSSAIHRVN